MSRLGRLAAGLAVMARARLGLLLVAALIGGLAGTAWGLSDRPDYVAVATVLVGDRGADTDLVGAGVLGGSGPDATERLLEFARSPEVAVAAAGALGADVSGADLIARTEFRGSDRGGAVVIRSAASSADFAAAATNAFAVALVETGARGERRRLDRISADLEQELGAVDPDSASAGRLSERLDAVASLQAAGPPLSPGREGELPTEPTDDRLVGPSALLGAGLGALIALLSIVVLELVRRPVRTPERLAEIIHAPTLASIAPGPQRGRGVLPSAEPGVLALTGAERDEYVSLAAAIGLLDDSVIHGDDRPRSLDAPVSRGRGAIAIAITSPMPGEGRTSVALGIAGVSAAAGAEVLLIEADMRRPVLASRLGLPAAPGLADYLTENAVPRDVMRTVPIVAADAGPAASFVCVTAGSEVPSPAELLYSTRFQGLVDRLRRVYDVVVFDTPPLLLSSDAAAVAARVDDVVLCAASGATRRSELDRAAAAVEHARLSGGVLTSVSRGGFGSRLLPARD